MHGGKVICSACNKWIKPHAQFHVLDGAQVFQASPQLASIRSVDEAVVIGVALSLSSSAFVLQLLNERGEMATKVGSATLGILLAQVLLLPPFTFP